jgi:hypothetical protein
MSNFLGQNKRIRIRPRIYADGPDIFGLIRHDPSYPFAVDPAS